MKKTCIYAMMVAAAALVSCTKTALAPLKGTFPAASEPVLTTLTSSTVSKTEANRLFTVSFSGEGGATLTTTLVGARSQYYLEPGVYGPGDKNLCFMVNGATTVNGQTVVDGQISVKMEENDTYRFVFVLFDAAGKAYRSLWKGTLAYEPDLEPVKLTQVITAQSNLGNGTASVTLSLGTSGITVTPGDYGNTIGGDGNYLAVDLYSADGYLHEGVYKASAAGGVIAEGEFGIGWDPGDLWGIGIVFENWGTCWWTVADGVSTAEEITSGTVEVAKKGGKWVITWGSEATYPKWAVFEGEIEALTPGDAPTPDYTYTEELADAVDNTFAPVAGVKTHKLVFKDDSGMEVAWFDLVLAEGETNLSGEYTCIEYAHEVFTFGNGYDLSAWGMGVGGSRYLDADGTTVVLINPGETLTVTAEAGGSYKFTGSTGYTFVAIAE